MLKNVLTGERILGRTLISDIFKHKNNSFYNNMVAKYSDLSNVHIPGIKKRKIEAKYPDLSNVRIPTIKKRKIEGGGKIVKIKRKRPKGLEWLRF